MKEWFDVVFVGTVREFWKKFGHERSSKWNRTRKEFIKHHDECEVCGKDKTLNVHHIVPFHVDPRKELVFSNLMTLCRTCHFIFGHLKYWRSWNENVYEDVEIWRKKMDNRKTK